MTEEFSLLSPSPLSSKLISPFCSSKERGSFSYLRVSNSLFLRQYKKFYPNSPSIAQFPFKPRETKLEPIKEEERPKGNPAELPSLTATLKDCRDLFRRQLHLQTVEGGGDHVLL